MVYKIKSNPIHPLSGALHLPYVLSLVSRHGALVVHWHSFTPSHCRTSQYLRTFVPFSVSLWNDLSDPVFDGVGLAGLKSRINAFLFAWSALFCLRLFYLFLPFMGWLCGVGVFGLIVFSLSPGLALWTPIIIIIIIIIRKFSYKNERQ